MSELLITPQDQAIEIEQPSATVDQRITARKEKAANHTYEVSNRITGLYHLEMRLRALDNRLKQVKEYVAVGGNEEKETAPPTDQEILLDTNRDWKESLDALKRLASKEGYLVDVDGNAYIASVFAKLIEAAYVAFQGNGSVENIVDAIKKIPSRFALQSRVYDDIRTRYESLASLEDNPPEFPKL
jgi:hypothetical protein